MVKLSEGDTWVSPFWLLLVLCVGFKEYIMNAVLQQAFPNTDETRQWIFKEPGMFNELQLDHAPVIQSYVQRQRMRGHMAIEDSTILFVIKGTNTIKCGDTVVEVHENEMVILTGGTLIEYDKVCDPRFNNLFEAMYFVIQDNLLKEFLKRIDLRKSTASISETTSLSAKPVKERLRGFLESVMPLLKEKDTVDKGLIKLKIFELLHHLVSVDQDMILEMLRVKKAVSENLIFIVEQHYLDPIDLPELAMLAGRSLSTFKREFEATYKSPPAKWIKERKLEKAKELLQNTSMQIHVVCKTTGFKNVSHFSRIFKKYFGYPPSRSKCKLTPPVKM